MSKPTTRQRLKDLGRAGSSQTLSNPPTHGNPPGTNFDVETPNYESADRGDEREGYNGSRDGGDAEVDNGFARKHTELVNPSRDIRGDLEEALRKPMEFKGSFCYEKSSTTVCNPLLRLDGHGHVGLPLGRTEAKAIISQCKRAPFGKGQTTMVDTSVRNTWEMDVRFDNPDWKVFMAQTVKDVCAALGVNFQVSRPRAELYKLLLYETGSHFLPHQDTEKCDGMFATIVVVLPSPFKGGAVHLSHGELSAIFDCSTGSLGQTSVLSWYTDVTHEVKPITKGYRLALSYNLIHTTNALRPSLPSNHQTVENLRHILLSWKTNADFEPLKIVYLLKHKYSQANLRGSALKGSDAHKVALLELLAKEHGFCIALASLECRVSGAANDMGYSDDPYAEELSTVGGDPSMEIDELEMKIENVVDLNGKAWLTYIDCDDEDKDDDEMIPTDIRDKVTSGRHDEEEYEGYQGNYGGSMERWYRRTVLILWPDFHTVEIKSEDQDDAEARAMDQIYGTNGEEPEEEERLAAEYLLCSAACSRLSSDIDETAECLWRAACAWKDLALWKRTIEDCDVYELGLFGKDLIMESVGTFGLANIFPTLEEMRMDDLDNTELFELIEDILGAALGMKAKFRKSVLAWAERERKDAIKSLRKPGSTEEIGLLVRVALQNGGLPVLQKTMLPQLVKLAEPSFLLSLAQYLQKERANITQSGAEQAALRSMSTDLLSSAIRKVDFFQHVKIKKDGKLTVGPSYHLAFNYIQACLSVRNVLLPGVIIDKITSPSKLASESAAEVIIPLISRMEAMSALSPNAPTIPNTDKLAQCGLALLVDKIGHSGPTSGDISSVVQTLALSGQPSLLLDIIIPMSASPWRPELIQELINLLRSYQARLLDRDGSSTTVSAAIEHLSKGLIQNPQSLPVLNEGPSRLTLAQPPAAPKSGSGRTKSSASRKRKRKRGEN